MAQKLQLQNVKHIFFDLDHTLWDYDRNSTDTLSALHEQFDLAAHGLRPMSEFIDAFHRANKMVWDFFDENIMNREELRNKRMELVYRDFGLENKAPEGFHEAYQEICSNGSYLIDGALELLDFLQHGYHLHIITNGFEEAQKTKLKASGIDQYFKTVTTSDLARSKKPDKEYFSFALRLAGATNKESLIVGDGLRTDVAGAIQSELPVIWYNPSRLAVHSETVVSVQTLLEIKAIFQDPTLNPEEANTP